MTDTFGTPAIRPSTPVHLWIIGILVLLWNAMGVFDYIATQIPIESYMSQFTQEQLDYFYGFPAWMNAVWAISVFSGLLGALALLLRKSWAVWLFGLSLLSAILATIYCFGLSDGMEVMGTTGLVFSVVMLAIAVFLVFYARAMSRRGVLS